MRVLKFDLLYPADYLLQKQKEHAAEIAGMNLKAYVDWLHALQISYGEVISKEFKSLGWEVQDFYNQDSIFLEKLIRETHINPKFSELLNIRRNDFLKFSVEVLKKCITIGSERKRVINEILIKRYIEWYNPDFIFLREPCQVNNNIFQSLKKKYPIVTLIGCNIFHPINWRPQNSDIIFTVIPEYKTFFEVNGIESHLFEYGITYLNTSRDNNIKKHDVTFVGLLGTQEQKRKSVLMERIAGCFYFKWWGPKGKDIYSYPNLIKTWQGTTAGTEMFEIYADSKIIVNDYVDTAKGQAVNMRIKEVFSTGSFLLTRNADNLQTLINENALSVFNSDDDCLEKIEYYLGKTDEREKIGRLGYKLGTKLYDSKKKIAEMKTIIEQKLAAVHNINLPEK